VVDENDAFRGGGYLTQLGRTLGIWLEDFGALVAPGTAGPGQVSAPFDLVGSTITGTLLAEEIHLDGAAALGRFVGGRLDGRPAFTVNPVGAGRAYYLATIPDDEGCAAVAAAIFAAADIQPVAFGLPDTVEAIRRGDVVTLINHGTHTVTLPDGATLEPFGYVMLRDGE
jgi:beta-galactosidase